MLLLHAPIHSMTGLDAGGDPSVGALNDRFQPLNANSRYNC
jgi:hypothetical protein